MWRSRKQGAKAIVPAWFVCDSDIEKVPNGYVPMVLVDKEDDEQGQRIMVHVQMLREPCMAALLDMAQQQFGLNQRGVLRIPCNVIHFEKMIKINGLMLEPTR
ncbi:hypothetical protein PR202_gb24365 [Eleusine coracana subsp. coracana]|uniref:Uncharacterized protein n=1 Tax=Eleusine coracana subsp. coracana TaxID=191504 RepID=A0AAV5FM90_ELECO|nr:hypothetical protein QOZ80_5BG0447580 [Eleusine coracana subsp. coracana]GJN35575.1 hypothetical protein PR202_gb24365 [Eleusine coracana subsp. coracana]